MSADQKRSVKIICGLFLVIAAVIVYLTIYQSPALRFAHRILPLANQTDTTREYRLDGCMIQISEAPEETAIHFHDADGAESLFYVSQEHYTVTAYNDQHEALLSGFWQGKQLCDAETKATLPEYEAMLQRQKTDTLAPEAADAIYIYKSYPDATRGGKRAPALILLVILTWTIGAARADTGTPLEWALHPNPEKTPLERALVPEHRYSKYLLNNNGETQKSAELKTIDRHLLLSLLLCFAACAAIALYDILCY